jgi:hypothetical protein
MKILAPDLAANRFKIVPDIKRFSAPATDSVQLAGLEPSRAISAFKMSNEHGYSSGFQAQPDDFSYCGAFIRIGAVCISEATLQTVRNLLNTTGDRVNNRKTDQCFELRIVNTTFRLMQLGTSELTFAITPGHSGALAGSGFSVDVERGIQKQAV